ncbi:MAG: Aminopeptidase [Chthonomonadales bacterium]|nr:Aminopeptidase [Chthonomonadales bacterium]
MGDKTAPAEVKYPGEITFGDIADYQQKFEANPRNRIALNAVTKTTVKNVAMNRAAVVRTNHVFSHQVKAGTATSQNSSGRCWMFAGLNLFRMIAAKEMNLEDFELSQNYTMFWDKLEKSNYFLESIMGTLSEPTDGRLISWLVASPIQDGGQWDMFVNLIKKYGVVPKTAMPETESSSSTGAMNDRVTNKLREYATQLRKAHADGYSHEHLRAQKEQMLEEIYRMLAIHLGEPPSEFEWQWRDKDKDFHRAGTLTPNEFYDKYVNFDLDSMVCLIHCPQSTKKFNTLYTINYLGNIIGGHGIRYINVELDVLKQASVDMIKDEKAVWFGCDVGKMFDRDLGLMDLDLYDYESIYGTAFGMDKAERLDYGTSLMTHAMVFTGVNLDDAGKPTKWRVENSWGDKNGDKGFMIMTDAWFDQYNYEVVVEKKYVPMELLKLLDSTPTELHPWDPMGSLASAE